MTMRRAGICLGLWAFMCAPPATAEASGQETVVAPAVCERLSSLTLPNTTITMAQTVPAGGFTPPATGGAPPQPFGNLPAFCRVAATLTPSADSDIKVEVWLPVARWNGKYLAVGNGAWAGSISYAAMRDTLLRGYATSSTDTGHSGPGGRFALGHPEKLIDYAYRSEHEMAVKAKALIAAFYGEAPRLSYWNGCSAGGKQGLKEAQRYPEDFDGIIAGAPASDWTGRAAKSLLVWKLSHTDEASYIPPAKYPVIHKAVLQACDALDGVTDGVLENPLRCGREQFRPESLACTGGDNPSCLTAPQVETAKHTYASGTSSLATRSAHGLWPGSELGWATWAGPEPFGTSADHFKYVVFKNPDWDVRSFNFATDFALADKVDGGTINALDADLSAFFRRGGKLIQYHGWSDPQISPSNSLSYRDSVVNRMGGTAKVNDSYRLFMVPGMNHCGGGPGTNVFDMVTALEQWVEKGEAPARIIASRVVNGTTQRTRPLCPHPQVARYTGRGSTDDAANFVCVSSAP